MSMQWFLGSAMNKLVELKTALLAEYTCDAVLGVKNGGEMFRVL